MATDFVTDGCTHGRIKKPRAPGPGYFEGPPPPREKINCTHARTRTRTRTHKHNQCVGFYGRIRYFGYCIGKVNRSKFTLTSTFGEVCTALLLFLTLHVTGHQPSDSFPTWNGLRPT